MRLQNKKFRLNLSISGIVKFLRDIFLWAKLREWVYFHFVHLIYYKRTKIIGIVGSWSYESNHAYAYNLDKSVLVNLME